jgi:hypothetical protein
LKRTHSFLAPALLLAALIAIVLAFVALANTILIACIVLTRYGSRQGKLLQKVGTGVDEFLRTALQLFSLRPPLKKSEKRGEKKKTGSTHDSVNSFILRFLKVQVMMDRMIASLVHRVKDNLHIEFTPSLFLEHERRLLDDYADHTAYTKPSASRVFIHP